MCGLLSDIYFAFKVNEVKVTRIVGVVRSQMGGGGYVFML